MTPPAVRIAVIGIALGLAVMILAVAIVVGFKKEVRNKVIGFGSHIQITNFDSNSSWEAQPITVSDTLLQELQSLPDIRHAEVFATKLGMIKTPTDFQGIVLKGVDTNYDWTFIRDNLVDGEIPEIKPDQTSTEVLISKYLANLLQLKTGDSFLAYFIREQILTRKYTISGIYETGFGDYDKLFMLGDIKQVRRLSSWADDQVGGIELKIDDYDNLDRAGDQIFYFLQNRRDANGNTYYSRTIRELNPMIFEWLGVLDLNVVIILVLMILVAGFTMISGLLTIILERVNTIGILKALGESDRSLRKVFLHISFFLIGKGMIWGNVIGVGLCLIQKYFRVIPLDPSDYYLDAVPIDLNIFYWILLNLGTLAVTLLMMLGPSYMIAKIEPAKTIRYE